MTSTHTSAGLPTVPPPRRLTPQATRNGGAVGMLVAHVRAEIRQNLRLPEYMVGVVAIPILLFAMFGLPEQVRSCPAAPTSAR